MRLRKRRIGRNGTASTRPTLCPCDSRSLRRRRPDDPAAARPRSNGEKARLDAGALDPLERHGPKPELAPHVCARHRLRATDERARDFLPGVPDAPPLIPLPSPPPNEHRRSFTLSRTVDRATGEIATREAARRRYEADRLPVPEACDYDVFGGGVPAARTKMKQRNAERRA
jgi:hypothetical protein